tara:strand:+ start:495 stop:797 length:303 start_codon:yes stop_codon:yes gene_type:complete
MRKWLQPRELVIPDHYPYKKKMQKEFDEDSGYWSPELCQSAAGFDRFAVSLITYLNLFRVRCLIGCKRYLRSLTTRRLYSSAATGKKVKNNFVFILTYVY